MRRVHGRSALRGIVLSSCAAVFVGIFATMSDIGRFQPYVAFRCPHCRYLNCFDSSGRPRFIRGAPPDANDEQRAQLEQRADESCHC